MTAFVSTAEYYRVLADPVQRLEKEGDFLKEVYEAGPGRKVADIACGTGIHARFFGGLGAEVIGMDISREMLDVAREHNGHENVEYAVGDMRDIAGGPYGLVVCLGNSLSLLAGMEAVEEVMKSACGVLEQGGLFVVQTLNYETPDAQQPRHRIVRKRWEGTEIIAVKDLVPTGDRTLLSMSFCAVEGEEYSTASESAILLNITAEMLCGMAGRAGFAVEGLYGDMQKGEFDQKESHDVVCVMKKGGK